MPKPLDVDLVQITGDNVHLLKEINTSCIPIPYGKSLYKEALKHPGWLAYYGKKAIGALSVRVDNDRLYIMTLAVLAPYRGRAVGTTLLQTVLQDDDRFQHITRIDLHTHVSNHDAVRFYTSRFAFQKGEIVRNYYNKRVQPPHCYHLFKILRETDKDDDSTEL